MTELLAKQEATLAALRKLLCPASTEKTAKVLEQAGLSPGEKTGKSTKDRETTAPPDSSAKGDSQTEKSPAPGHGRNGADAYEGAQKIVVPHAFLKKGDACPLECDGKLYPLREPKVLLRIHGQAPIAATQYELERLRCHSCGEIFTAAAPPGVGEKKYDETAVCITKEIAEQAGLLKAQYAKRGKTISFQDASIAAVCIAHGCMLVTENVKDFPMPELELYPLPKKTT